MGAQATWERIGRAQEPQVLVLGPSCNVPSAFDSLRAEPLCMGPECEPKVAALPWRGPLGIQRPLLLAWKGQPVKADFVLIAQGLCLQLGAFAYHLVPLSV